MTTEEQLSIAKLQSSVQHIEDTLRENLPVLFSKCNAAAEDSAYLRGRFDMEHENHHTPLTCPIGKDVETLKGFKAKLLGMAAVASFIIGIAIQFIKGLVSK